MCFSKFRSNPTLLPVRLFWRTSKQQVDTFSWCKISFRFFAVSQLLLCTDVILNLEICFPHLCSAFQQSHFSFLPIVVFLFLVLQGITFTIVAMVFTTITILALKVSSSSLNENQDKTGAEEKTWFKISLVSSALTLYTLIFYSVPSSQFIKWNKQRRLDIWSRVTLTSFHKM